MIASHVDDTSGPKVYFRLRELVAGDQVLVTRSDGRQVTFTVDAVAQCPKSQFPAAAVYGPQPRASLRLITCGGSLDGAARSYRDNVVVYASEGLRSGRSPTRSTHRFASWWDPSAISPGATPSFRPAGLQNAPVAPAPLRLVSMT